jgi:anti-anti-sigma regulatory factor
VVVEFPDEFDFGSAGDVAVRLRAAIAAGVSVVVADLTTAAFCGSCGVRIMLLARD